MLVKENISYSVEITDINRLSVVCDAKASDCHYAYYIYHEGKCIQKTAYMAKKEYELWITQPGEYKVTIFIKNAQGEKITVYTRGVSYEVAYVMNHSYGMTNKNSFLGNAVKVIKEYAENASMILRISQFDYKLLNKDTYLGKLWSILTPLIQIGTYWLVFGIGLKKGKDVNGVPFLIWMVCGLTPWFFMGPAVTKGANSIYTKAGVITRMRFPIAVIPCTSVLETFYEHLMTVAVMAFMLICFGFYPHIGWLNLIYYFAYSIVFLTSLSLITSVLTMIARDFYKLLQSAIRLLFYLTPILWRMDAMPHAYQQAMRANPIYYVVNGFRLSILERQPFYADWRAGIFFWMLNLILFAHGANLQMRFRNRFIDLI